MAAELPELHSQVKVELEDTPDGGHRAWVKVKRPGAAVADELRYNDLMGTPSNIEEDRAIKREATRQLRALEKEWKPKPPSAESAETFEILRVVSDRSPFSDGFDPTKHFTVYYLLGGIERKDTPASLNRAIQAHTERYPENARSLIATAVREKEKSLKEQCRPAEVMTPEPAPEDVPTAAPEASPVKEADKSDLNDAAAVEDGAQRIDPGQPSLPMETLPAQPAEPAPGAEAQSPRAHPEISQAESAYRFQIMALKGGEGAAIAAKREEEAPRVEASPIDWSKAVPSPSDKTKNDLSSRSIIRMVEDSGLEVFTDQFKEPYAAIERDGHREIMAIASTEFELWLRYLHYRRSGGEGLGDDPLKRAVSTLKARAVFEGRRYELALRITWHDGELWYDLGRDDWSAVRIGPNAGPQGWEVVARPPIMFKRIPQMIAQDIPEPGGDWTELWECINLPLDDYGVLCRSHLVHLFLEGHPRPFLDIYNRRGAAKSTTSGYIRALVDPSTTPKAPLMDVDRNFNNIMDQNYLPVFDNLKTITPALEDKFCRTITGEASQERRLGTNRAQEVYQYRRTGILTSVHPLGLNAPEVAARIIYLEAPYIREEDRLTEAELDDKFYRARPKILSHIFSAIAKAISIRAGLVLENLPRFADYTLWGEAISRALGEEEGAFVREYRASISQTISATLDENPLAQAILQYFEDKKTDHYIGTAEPLYLDLQLIARDKNIDTKSKEAASNWPGAANALSRKMPDIIDDLKQFDLHYAKVEYRDLSEVVKAAMPEQKLSAGRSILMIIKKGSKWFGELPAERHRAEKKRYSKNIVSPSQQLKKDAKNDKTIFASSRSGEGRSGGA